MRQIGLYFQSISGGDAGAALAALASPSPATRQRLEEAVAAGQGAAAAFAVGSGRSAILLWLRGIGIQPGDEVVVTGFTCLAVIEAVLAAGAVPVYADIDPRSLNATLATIAPRVTPRSRAIIVQHTLGNPADVEPIAVFARARGLEVLEDCALAAGSLRQGRRAGTFASAAIFSFELSKTVSSGWGGVLVINDAGAVERMRAAAAAIPGAPPLATLRRTIQTVSSALCYRPTVYGLGKYIVAALFNAGLFRASADDHSLHRLAAPQARMAERQWRRLPETSTLLTRHRAALAGAIESCGGTPLPAAGDGDTIVSNRVSLLIEDPAAAVEWFRARGVETGRWFDDVVSPMPADPATIAYRRGECPVAEAVGRRIFNLPCHPGMTAADTARVARLLEDYLSGAGRVVRSLSVS